MTNDRQSHERRTPPDSIGVAISRADLELLAALSAARFADPTAEGERARLVIGAHAAGQALATQLALGSRHAISESRGSHSRWDVDADLLAAFDALVAYAAELRRVAARYGTPGGGSARLESEHETRPADRRLHAI
jgi:hypothetical protein